MLSKKNAVSRRAFIKNSLMGATALAYASVTKMPAAQTKLPLLRHQKLPCQRHSSEHKTHYPSR